MARLNAVEGSIVAYCTGCHGGKSTFEWVWGNRELGAVTKIIEGTHKFGAPEYSLDYRLFRCAGCGMGAWGAIAYKARDQYPGAYNDLLAFYPEAKQRLKIPEGTPEGIVKEFREAEICYENDCFRASAGLFRSVLDKTLRANGYNTKIEYNLYKQIEAAADDGVITQARKIKAHEDIRVLGNDVLHDDWCEISPQDVEEARHYCQRILEDFFDDRETILTLLQEAGRMPDDG